MPFDPSQYVQPPTSPVDWAQLEQRSSEAFANAISQQQAQRQQQRQFDVGAAQDQQRIDEVGRSNLATERYNEGMLGLNIDQEARLGEVQAHAERQAEYKRKSEIAKTIVDSMGKLNSRNKFLATTKALEDNGLVFVPGEGPGDPNEVPEGPDGQPVTDDMLLSAEVQAPGGEGLVPAAADPSHPQHAEYLQGVTEGGERSLAKPPQEMVDGKMMATVPQVAPGDGLGVTDAPARGIPKAPPTREELLATAKAHANTPRTDLKGDVERAHVERIQERFREGMAEISKFKISDPIVDGAARNLLYDRLGADDVGIERPAPTMALPVATEDRHPDSPPEAAVTPESRIPPEVLGAIEDMTVFEPDPAIETFSDHGGKGHVIDTATGQQVGKTWSYNDIMDAQQQSVTDSYTGLVKAVAETPRDLERGMALAVAAAENPDDPQVQATWKHYLDIMSDDKSAAAAENRARIAGPTALTPAQSADDRRADQGQQISIEAHAQAREKELRESLTKNHAYPKLRASIGDLSGLEGKLTSKNPTEQREAIRQLAKNVEGRMTDADFAYYAANGLGAQFRTTLNQLASEGELAPTTIRNGVAAIRSARAFNDKHLATFVDLMGNTIKNDSGLIRWGRTPEQLDELAHLTIASLVPEYRPPARKKSSFGPLLPGMAPPPDAAKARDEAVRFEADDE